MAKLEVRNLTISFRTNNGAVRAVRDISFNLNAGETLAVAGESGSGKSVTARAVMGILAGNAMVEGGEIIYDGRDLLKIPEEEFHTLRGHRLAMVFQDPLSALNPIMRIGRQLTEAMILNNKERRADGRKRFNAMLAQLEKDIGAAKGGDAGVADKVRRFKAFTSAGVKLENEYNTARENAVGAQDCVEEADLALLRRDARAIPEITRRMTRLAAGAANPWLIDGKDEGFQSAVRSVKSVGLRYKPHQEAEFRAAIDVIKAKLSGALEGEQPNFFRIGWLAQTGAMPDPTRESVADINARALKALDDGFMTEFLADIEKAIAYSRTRSQKARVRAVEALREALPVFRKDALDRAECTRAAKKAAEAVRASIDPLALDKDNRAYVFESSIKAGIERYFEGLSRNPREQKRFEKETAQYEKLAARGKAVASVVPMNLVDLDKAHAALSDTVEDLITHFENGGAVSTLSDAEQAVRMVDYLKERSQEYSYRLTQGMARHRAIDLMKEVGIPEPHKRFDQYPFEFSGGMRQRIVIAIALSANPDILICDEPTTALDVTIQAQILELINRLKVQRKLSVIFITHDLGVVANMADRIAVMYAGKIVEYGTADDVFYDPRHPYTWALLASMPDLETKEKLDAIPGTPPNMIVPPKGDAFAARNRYAMEIDLEEQPPMFRISETHTAATWLLHPNAPKVEPPAIVRERIERMRRRAAEQKGGDQA